MKVAVVSQPWAAVLPPSESLAVWTEEVATRLAAHAEVVVLSRGGGPLERDGVRYLPVPSEADWREQKLLELARPLLPRRRPLFATRLYHRRYFAGAAESIVGERCDVAHLLNFAQPARAVKRVQPRTRVVLHMQCDWLSQLDPRLVRRRAEDVDLVLGCSDYITRRAQPVIPGVRCETLYNGVDADVFRPDPARPGHGEARLLFVGRVSPDKGVHVLLHAAARLAEAHPGLELELVGDEALPPLDMQAAIDRTERVQALARFYGGDDGYLAPLLAALPSAVASRLRHTTWIGREELAARYRAATLLVIPSVVDEAFGMPLAEGMASGLPIVATRVGGIPEVVEDRVTGLLVPPDDVRALAEAIDALLRDPQRARALGEAGRRRALELFTWDRVAERARALYDELVEASRASSAAS